MGMLDEQGRVRGTLPAQTVEIHAGENGLRFDKVMQEVHKRKATSREHGLHMAMLYADGSAIAMRIAYCHVAAWDKERAAKLEKIIKAIEEFRAEAGKFLDPTNR